MLAEIGRRHRGEHARLLEAPDELALALALRCGIGGESPEAVLARPRAVAAADVASDLATLLNSGERTVVWMEVE